jgi:hypothetical protein
MMLAAVSGCGDDGGTPPPLVDNNLSDGYAVDAPIYGMSYAYALESGVTEADGKFFYEPGNDVTFSIGSIEFGTVAPVYYVSPLTWAGAIDVTDDTATNMARLLQSIDDDGNPANGIRITAAMRTAAAGQVVDFQQDPASFAADTNVQDAVADITAATTAGVRTLIDAATAQTNLTNGLRAAYAGGYEGDFCVISGESEAKGGTWDLDVLPDGSVSIGFNGTPSFVATGVMSINGEINLAIPGGGTLFGSFEEDFNGVWTVGESSGTFYEEKKCGSQ